MSERPPGDAIAPAARRPALPDAVAGPLDVVLGASALVLSPAIQTAGAMTAWARPVVLAVADAVAYPPLVPVRWTPGAFVAAVRRQGTEVRRAATYDLAIGTGAAADAVVPITLDVVLSRVDLTEVVLAQVDLGRLVDAALDQVDLTTLVTTRVDLTAVVTAALDGLDLTELVLSRVDLGQVVGDALEQVDLTEIVRTQVDLAALADEVIDEVDLPEIIRESSTGVVSDVVQGTRLGAIDADDRVSRLVDRVLLRRRARDTDAPGDVDDGGPVMEPGEEPGARGGGPR